MRLTSIDVRSVRNLSDISIQPGPGLNIFYGPNGSGKTSLLEAISILSSGRSFRAGKIGSIIQNEADSLIVSAEVHNEKKSTNTRVGISRSNDKVDARIDGRTTNRISELAIALPCVNISTKNHELIEGGPGERRSFMDWISFHVDHSYLSASKRYRSALQQRNAALRNNQNQQLIQSWDNELAYSGELISISRNTVIEDFVSRFSKLAEIMPETTVPKFSYQKGWALELSLKDHLARNIDYCRRMGGTTAGPHRAELKIKIGKNDAKYIYSRGQQKLLAILMRLAQVEMYSEFHDHPPILLFDDLPSELDENARAFVFNFLSTSKIQVFLTSVEDVSKEIQSVNTKFHVEQGQIKKVLY